MPLSAHQIHRSGCATWMLRLSGSESFPKCSFTPECSCTSAHTPAMGTVFLSCRWETSMLRDRVTYPWSEWKQQSKEPSCYPVPLHRELLLGSLLFCQTVSFCNAALSFSLGLLFSRKPSGQKEPVLWGLRFSLWTTLQRRNGNPDCTQPQAVISDLPQPKLRLCLTLVVIFCGLNS